MQQRHYGEAQEAYQKILNESGCDVERRQALLELARCHQTERHWDQAIETYTKFLAEPRRQVSVGNDVVYGYEGLTECFFEKGSYGKALDAVRATRRQGYHSFCGTCDMLHGNRQVLREAVLSEYVQDYDAAVSGYFTLGDAHTGLRLLALYEAAGQLPDLMHLVEQENRWYDALMRPYRTKCAEGGYCPPGESELHRTVHGMLAVRELERARDWPTLLSLLEPLPKGEGWTHPPHELREAARLLARHPKATLPLLLPNVSKREYFAYALGLTGRPEAVAALREEVTKEKNFGQLLALIDDLLLAGPSGAAALDALYPDAQDNVNLRLLIDRYRQGTLGDLRSGSDGEHRVFPFPPTSKRARLPKTCTFRGAPANAWECTLARG